MGIANKESQEDKPKYSIISGTTFGSSIVGMVHVLNSANMSVGDTPTAAATSMHSSMDAGGWLAGEEGTIGINDKFAADVKNLLSQQNVTIISPETKAESSDAEIATKIRAQSERVASELATLDDAFNHKVLYVIGKEQMKIKKGTNYFRRVFLSMFLWMRENSRNKIANLNVPTDRVVEVGFLKEI